MLFSFQEPLYLSKIDSTNSYMQRLLTENYLDSGYTIVALEQTAGKGRRGRKWTTVPKKDLMFSFLLANKEPFKKIGSLPMACALAIVDLLASYKIKAQVKWPNDVLVNGKKIAGILTECITLKQLYNYILGIGLNVNAKKEDLDSIQKEACSIYTETNIEYDLKNVLANLMFFLQLRLTTWLDLGFDGIKNDYMSCLYGLGKFIKVSCGNNIVEGVLQNIGADAELILLENNIEKKIWSVEEIEFVNN